jgi:hypothetical protein
VKVWQHGDAEPRLLSPSNREQWHPWIHGDHVVWIDQRHGEGERGSPDNPEVYYHNLRTGETRRITNDPPERAVAQDSVVVEGDWIAWTDRRTVSDADSGAALVRSEIYGYHIPTSREVVLVSDPNCLASQPMLLGGRRVFAAYPVSGRSGEPMYEAPLPAMPMERDP